MILGIQTDVRYLHLSMILACGIVGAIHFSVTLPDLLSDNELTARCDRLCTEADDVKHPWIIPLSEMRDSPAKIGITGCTDDVHRPPNEIVKISCTSGTTGRRKFVYETQYSLWHAMRMLEYMLRYDQSRYPLVSIYRFGVGGTYTDTMLALKHGLSATFCEPRDFLTAIRMSPGCHAFLLVGDAARFAEAGTDPPRPALGCSLRVIGGALNATLRARLTANLSTEIRGVYSSNETGCVALTDDDGAATVAADTEIRIVDDDGSPRNDGEQGTIVVRSPSMCGGYLWDDELNAKHFVDGWFRTNDIGFIPAAGKLIVVGRDDDMLNIDGIKLAPTPTEERIRSIAGVDDAVLVSHVNPDGICQLHVFVERANPDVDSRIDEQLVAILKQQVGSFVAHFSSAFPRTATGKIRRNVLRQFLENQA